jgi:hypothetical protein
VTGTFQIWSVGPQTEYPIGDKKRSFFFKIILHRIISVVYILRFTSKLAWISAMMMIAMACPEREKMSEINFFCHIDDCLVVTAYDYLGGHSIGWVVLFSCTNSCTFFKTKCTSGQWPVMLPNCLSQLNDFSNMENLKASWPWRDLNTQPSDLESDALPLRHRVN